MNTATPSPILLNAVRNLPSDAIRRELAEVQNAVAHLRRTNHELVEAIKECEMSPGTATQEDVTLYTDTIEENEEVVLRKLNRAKVFMFVLRERNEPATKLEDTLMEDIVATSSEQPARLLADNNEDDEAGVFL